MRGVLGGRRGLVGRKHGFPCSRNDIASDVVGAAGMDAGRGGRMSSVRGSHVLVSDTRTCPGRTPRWRRGAVVLAARALAGCGGKRLPTAVVSAAATSRCL